MIASGRRGEIQLVIGKFPRCGNAESGKAGTLRVARRSVLPVEVEIGGRRGRRAGGEILPETTPSAARSATKLFARLAGISDSVASTLTAPIVLPVTATLPLALSERLSAPAIAALKSSLLSANFPDAVTPRAARPARFVWLVAAFCQWRSKSAAGAASVPLADTVPETAPSAARSGTKPFAMAAGTLASVASTLTPPIVVPVMLTLPFALSERLSAPLAATSKSSLLSANLPDAVTSRLARPARFEWLVAAFFQARSKLAVGALRGPKALTFPVIVPSAARSETKPLATRAGRLRISASISSTGAVGSASATLPPA